MIDSFELEGQTDVSDDPLNAALRLILPMASVAGLCLLCLVLIFGAIVMDPYNGLTRVERDRVDPAPLSVPAPSTSTGSASASMLGLQAVAAARSDIGKPYVWGASGPNSFDCSGLVQWAWAQVGIRIPKFTVDQYNAAIPVQVADLQPGDLVFLQYTYPADYRITHVGLFTERGTVIEAPEPGLAVREVRLGRYTATNFFGAARPRLSS